jgi:hypothetical protein
MKVVVVKDSPILIPNPTHRNFTHAGSMVEKDTIVKGQPKSVQGLRQGRPHIYKFFITEDGHLLHIKNVKPYKMITEVKLGADAQVTPTKVNMTAASSKASKKYIGAIAGAIAGFGLAKYKKHDKKKQIMFSVVGGLAGFGIGYYLEGGASRVKVNPSK